MRLRSGFTLIELLVVIAIVAILAVVVLLVLNPAQLLKQGRDSNRIAELASLNKALAVYTTDVGTSGLGSASTTYVSIPDISATCANLGLPALPTGWNYHCVTADTLRDTDGTGWIPVNFGSISFRSPLGSLPIDPINTTSTRNYYTYTTYGGKYELTAQLESDKYEAKAGADGGEDPVLFEYGTNETLAPFAGGMVGWWEFEEGSGSSVLDSSGYGSTGTWNGTSTTRYVSGKVGGYAGTFNGLNDFVDIPGSSSGLQTSSTLTASAWVKWNSGNGRIFQKDDRGSSAYTRLWEMGTTGGTMRVEMWHSSGASTVQSANALTSGVWQHLAITFDGTSVKMYQNGALTKTISFSGDIRTSSATPFTIGGQWLTGEFFNGAIDDVRLYNRALSDSEIQALYNATR